MVLSLDTSDLVVAIQTLRASADVFEVEDDPSFLASVRVVPGHTSVARLTRGIEQSSHGGPVLHEVMVCTAGTDGPGLHFWFRDSDGTLRRLRG